MSTRPGKSRPMPAAPFDDPSIPVLTERLVLPELKLDVSLPAETDDISSSAPTPVPVVTPPPRADSPAPMLLGSEFETDDWLVETIPLAPAPIDLSSFDLPPLDLQLAGLVTPDPPPPVAETPPAVASTPLRAVPVSEPPPAVPQPSRVPPAPSAPEPGFAPTEMLIPASLIRVPAPPSAAAVASLVERAPTFDRLPTAPSADTLPTLPTFPTLDTPGGAATAFAASQAVSASSAPAQWTNLEIELRESILRDLLARLPEAPTSHTHISTAVEAVVAEATAQFAARLRQALTDSLHDLVEQAVRDELARMRELKH